MVHCHAASRAAHETAKPRNRENRSSRTRVRRVELHHTISDARLSGLRAFVASFCSVVSCCRSSGRLTPAGATSISTSPEPGVGIGRSNGDENIRFTRVADSIAIMIAFQRRSLSRCTREQSTPRRHEDTKKVLVHCHAASRAAHETAKPRNHENRSSRTRVRRAGLQRRPARTVETDGGRNRIRLLAVTSVVRFDRSSAAPRRASNSTTRSATRAFPAFVAGFSSCLRAFVAGFSSCLDDRHYLG